MLCQTDSIVNMLDDNGCLVGAAGYDIGEADTEDTSDISVTYLNYKLSKLIILTLCAHLTYCNANVCNF